MAPICLEDVLINEELQRREPRPAQPDLENEALHELMQQFSRDSQTFLEAVVETACRLCGGDSAGISLQDTMEDGTTVVRWVAATGLLRAAKDLWIPGTAHPAGR